MKITKFGHCCLLIEEKELRILTDPGAWNKLPEELGRIDIVLITHEHSDHLHTESLQRIVDENPDVKVYTNSGVGKILDTIGIKYSLLENGGSVTEKEVLIEGFGLEHANLYPSVPNVQNTGYFIANRLFYPGDALTDPGKDVEILALPVAGPWMKISEGVDFAIKVKAKTVFAVHDGGILHGGGSYAIPPIVLEPKGVKFLLLDLNKEYEF